MWILDRIMYFIRRKHYKEVERKSTTMLNRCYLLQYQNNYDINDKYKEELFKLYSLKVRYEKEYDKLVNKINNGLGSYLKNQGVTWIEEGVEWIEQEK